MSRQAANPLNAWLSEFLLIREHLRGPTGQPLYQYQVTADEYSALRDLLRMHRDLQGHYLYGDAWASAFCLFVAERFRREYDGSDEGWSWIPFERQLDCKFAIQDRAHAVERGLEFWRRPVRRSEDRRQLLGSLFLEGGLPWSLVQDDSHGFGRVVRRALKYHYRTEGGRKSTAELIAEQEELLPLTFQTLETRHLLAGVVEQLISLTRQYPLTDIKDPAAYLDSRDKRWRDTFPLPLDEANARTLINEWLRAADRSNHERAEAIARERDFACAHRLVGEPGILKFVTELTLPVEEILNVDMSLLRSTRLAVGLHEGERQVGQSRASYGRLQENRLVVPYAVPRVALERQTLAEPVSLRLSEGGRLVHTHTFEGSQIDLDDAPLVFEGREDQWWLVAVASCRLNVPKTRVRLPPGASILSGTAIELGTDNKNGRWLESTADLVIRVGEEQFSIGLNAQCTAGAGLQLKGILCPYETVPSTTYLGRPYLDVPADAGYVRSELLEFENGRPVAMVEQHARAACIRYSVRSRAGETVLIRRFGMLPRDFRIQIYPATGRTPAVILLRQAAKLQCHVLEVGVTATTHATEEGLRLELRCARDQPPSHVDLELVSQAECGPVRIRVPYPLVGARLFDSQNLLFTARELTTDQLLGARLVLFSSRPQDFYLLFRLSLSGNANLNIQRHYRVRVNDQPVSVGLHGYLQDIRQMLGCAPEQHASVRLQVETDREHRRLDIGRYSGYLHPSEGADLVVLDAGGRWIAKAADIEAMSVTHPGRLPVSVVERLTAGVGTGYYVTPPELERDGPWILYPSRRSKLKFAPRLHPGSGVECAGKIAGTLKDAVRLYHPRNNPDVIDTHVAAMAEDLDNNGWQYLSDLRKHFDHLPLSSFATWQSLAEHGEALAVALIRLELDLETSHRMRDELAVIWEAVPLQVWVRAFGRARAWLQAKHLPEQVTESILVRSADVLQSLVPSFDRFAGLILTGQMPLLSKPPWFIVEGALKNYYDQLRRNHADDPHWPTDLGAQLTDWVARQRDLPASIVQLANVEFARAVTYLPLFMGFVSAGKASLSELRGPPPYVKFAVRTLAEFDWRGWYVEAHGMTLAYLATQDGIGS